MENREVLERERGSTFYLEINFFPFECKCWEFDSQSWRLYMSFSRLRLSHWQRCLSDLCLFFIFEALESTIICFIGSSLLRRQVDALGWLLEMDNRCWIIVFYDVFGQIKVHKAKSLMFALTPSSDPIMVSKGLHHFRMLFPSGECLCRSVVEVWNYQWWSLSSFIAQIYFKFLTFKREKVI